MATTTYFPSAYGSAEFLAPGSGSTAGTSTYQANYQDTTPNSYIVVTSVDGTNPQEYEITSGYTGPGTGTTYLAFQTPYSDTNHTETYAPDVPIGGGATQPAYFILSNSPVTSSTQYTFTGQSSPFVPTTDSNSDPTVCFVSGTLIKTARGDTVVEALQIGEVVLTAMGAEREIKWIGHRTIDCRNHPRPHETMPVRIGAHAFGDCRPSRDLFVSPGHSICVDVLGEVLIPAIALVNGSTIQQVDVETVTYWHVELESHDVILAENLPAESYLEMGNRSFFKDADVVDLVASPDADPVLLTHADFCRPFVNSGPVLDAVTTQLRRRAESMGWVRSASLEMYLIVDGMRLDPVYRDLTARFEMPAGAREVWLVSPAARPCDVIGTGDGRELGLYINALSINDGFGMRDVAIDDPLLCIGFHAVEEGYRRWTSGRAKLPAALWESCKDGFYLRIDLAGMPLPRWTAPTAETASVEELSIVA